MAERDDRTSAQQLGERVRELGGRAWQHPRWQELRSEVQRRTEHWRGELRGQADERLEELIERRRQQGQAPAPEVEELLADRRRDRERRREQQRRHDQLLALARTPDERRVLTQVARATPWAGGQEPAARYTALLDTLAPGGEALREMAIHRAIWSLAERRVLAVSPHGEVTACE